MSESQIEADERREHRNSDAQSERPTDEEQDGLLGHFARPVAEESGITEKRMSEPGRRFMPAAVTIISLVLAIPQVHGAREAAPC